MSNTHGVDMKIEIKLIPDGMDLSKAIQDGMPVEKMEEACPIATPRCGSKRR